MVVVVVMVVVLVMVMILVMVVILVMVMVLVMIVYWSPAALSLSPGHSVSVLYGDNCKVLHN